jgi:hypothetical protein
MNIKLSDSWYIKSDSLNIMLVQVLNGRDYLQGYYQTLQGAIESYIERKIKGSEATSIQSLLIYLKALVTALNDCLTPLRIEVVMPKKEEDGSKC